MDEGRATVADTLAPGGAADSAGTTVTGDAPSAQPAPAARRSARPAEGTRPALSPADSGPSGFFTDTEVVGREHWLRMHLNESPYGPPPGVAETVTAAATDHLDLYPDSECRRLRERLARHFDVPTGMVGLGNGADELVLLASLAFLRGTGGTVALTANTFPGYLNSASALGADVRTLPLRDDAVPVEDMAAQLSGGVDLAWVCNPLNPTGSVLSSAKVAALVDAAEDGGGALVLDEAYMDFAGEAHEFALRAVREGRRLLVLRTFSKAWGLASLRLGCAVGHADLVARLEGAASAVPFSVSRPAQAGVVRALDASGHIERVRRETARARALLTEELDVLGLRHAPSVTNFVMVETPGSSTELASRLAEEHQILVRDLDGLGLPGRIRVTVGTAAQVKRLATALTAVLDR